MKLPQIAQMTHNLSQMKFCSLPDLISIRIFTNVWFTVVNAILFLDKAIQNLLI